MKNALDIINEKYAKGNKYDKSGTFIHERTLDCMKEQSIEFIKWIAENEYSQTVRESLLGMWTNDCAVYLTHSELYNVFLKHTGA